jgi:hypothetical protein
MIASVRATQVQTTPEPGLFSHAFTPVMSKWLYGVVKVIFANVQYHTKSVGQVFVSHEHVADFGVHGAQGGFLSSYILLPPLAQLI